MRPKKQVNAMMRLITVILLLAAAARPEQQPGPGQPPGGGYSAGAMGEAVFQIDPQTGSLIVLTDERTNEQIQQIIASLDRPVLQVLIKVLFLEVRYFNDLDLGVEASFRTGATQQTRLLLNSDGTPRLDASGMPWIVDYDTEGNQLPVQFEDTVETLLGLAAEPQGAFWRVIKDDFDMTIRALAQVGKMEVLSRPSILARNNEEAIITLGERLPYISNFRETAQGQIINTLDYEDIGIILQVTPHITPDGLVEMVLSLETSARTGETVPISTSPRIDRYVIAQRSAQTTVVVPDSMTVVIGGLMQDNETEATQKVPILGDVPWLGAAFRRTVKEKSKTELLIFLTPHVVYQTRQLETVSAMESKKAELAPTAFTESELDKHLDNWAKLIAEPKDVGVPGLFKRFGRWIQSTVMAFR